MRSGLSWFGLGCLAVLGVWFVVLAWFTIAFAITEWSLWAWHVVGG